VAYLLEHAVRRPALAGRLRQGARVDERLPLNLPELDGGAHVRVFVEDTSGHRRLVRRTPPVPFLRLRIADCLNEVHLEFSVETPELRENSLYKIETLLGALRRFQYGVEADAALYTARSQR
jgi:hypothetical protein